MIHFKGKYLSNNNKASTPISAQALKIHALINFWYFLDSSMNKKLWFPILHTIWYLLWLIKKGWATSEQPFVRIQWSNLHRSLLLTEMPNGQLLIGCCSWLDWSDTSQHCSFRIEWRQSTNYSSFCFHHLLFLILIIIIDTAKIKERKRACLSKKINK